MDQRYTIHNNIQYLLDRRDNLSYISHGRVTSLKKSYPILKSLGSGEYNNLQLFDFLHPTIKDDILLKTYFLVRGEIERVAVTFRLGQLNSATTDNIIGVQPFINDFKI